MGKNCCQLSPSTSLSAASLGWLIASASAVAACSGVANCCWAKAASGDSINVNRATDNGFLILLILSGDAVHGVRKDVLWRPRVTRGLRRITGGSAVLVPAALARGGAAFVAAKGVGAQMAERLLTLGWRGGLELLPALLLLRCAVLLVALAASRRCCCCGVGVFSCVFAASRRCCWVGVLS